MKKKPYRVFKLQKETLRSLSEHVLGDIHGEASARTDYCTTVLCDPWGVINVVP